MLFSEMTETQKVTALTKGKHLKCIGQGNFETCIVLQNDGLDVEVEWEDGRKDWISINSFGSTWKLLNANKKKPFITKKVTLQFETEQESQALLERIKNPRQRALILLEWIEKEPSKPLIIY
jgi:hypothetical protein